MKVRNFRMNEDKDKIKESILSLSPECYIPADVSYNSRKSISINNCADKKRHNSYLIKKSYLEEALQKAGIKLIDAIKLGYVFPKTTISFKEQLERFLERRHPKKPICKSKAKVKGTYKYDISNFSEIIGSGTIDKQFAGWISDNKKRLEKESTKSEAILTKRLVKTFKNRLKTQQPFLIKGHVYYADICLKSKKVIIEVDGGYHNEDSQRVKDKERDKAFESIGYRTLRIKNEEVKDRKKVSELIKSINIIQE